MIISAAHVIHAIEYCIHVIELTFNVGLTEFIFADHDFQSIIPAGRQETEDGLMRGYRANHVSSLTCHVDN